MAPQVDVEVNLQLAATQRIHALWRPLERNFRDNTFDVFEPNRGWTVRTSGEPYNLFYEGQPFNWLTPGDSFPLDVTLAGGRLPLFLHNGLSFNNTLDGFALSKNNLQAGTLSNLNVVYFLTRGQPHGGITPFEKAEARKRVMGLYADADWYEYFVEASWAVAYDNARGPKGADLNRNFWAVSITRTAGFAGLTFRALGSTANDTRDAGVLFVLEGEKEFLGVRGYAVVFGATADWLPVSEEAATMSREGILFTFDRLAPTPGLNPRGSDSVGGVLGIIFNPRGLITVTPEVGWLLDNPSQVIDQRCAKCHGKSGHGDGQGLKDLDAGVVPVDWTDKSAMAKWSDGDLAKIIDQGGKALGKSKVMPAYHGKLSPEEIAQLVAYIRSLGK